MITRFAPKMPVQAYKTYEIAMPKATHWRKATCDEVDCAHYRQGWVTRVDESIDLGRSQAHYIRTQSRRGFTEERDAAGLTVFTFEAGQRCFREHETPLARPQLHAVRGGDWRGMVGDRHIYDRPDQWREDLAIQLDALRGAQG